MNKSNCTCHDHQKGADLFRALGHPARLAILHKLASCPHQCCQHFVSDVGLAQSTVSQHLKILLEAGLLERETRGTQSFYKLTATARENLATHLHDMAQWLRAPQSQENT